MNASYHLLVNNDSAENGFGLVLVGAAGAEVTGGSGGANMCPGGKDPAWSPCG